MSDTEPEAPAQQREDHLVGPGHPPKECQFKPGQSGNPKGSPKPRTNLYKHVARYAGMTDAELARIDHASLTQSEKAALEIVTNLATGQGTGSERMARYVIDREEGKAIEHLVIDNDNDLTDQECEQIREVLLNRHADSE